MALAAHGRTARLHGPSRLGDPGCRCPHVVRIRRATPPDRYGHLTPHRLLQSETAAGTERCRRGRRWRSTSAAEDEPPAGLRKDRGESGLGRRRPGRDCRWRRGTEPTPSGGRLPIRSIDRGTSEAATPLQPGNMDLPRHRKHLQACPPGSTDYSISGGRLRRPTQQVVAPGDPTPPVVAGGRADRPAPRRRTRHFMRLVIECSDSRAGGPGAGLESAPERRPAGRPASRDRSLQQHQELNTR